jgi:DNA modification methylase
MNDHFFQGDSLEVLKTFAPDSIDCCVTSPPYFGLRDYGVAGQIGSEKTPDEFVSKMRCIFYEVYRVLKPAGTLWLNLGDSYAGSNQGAGTKQLSEKQESNRGTVDLSKKKSLLAKIEGLKSKDLVGIPWRVALALQSDGWYLRQDIIWHKPNPMPESVTDRCTKSHEYVFLMTKSAQYYFDIDSIREPWGPDQREAGITRAKRYGYTGKGTYQEWYNNERKGKDWVNKKETKDNLTYGQAKKLNANPPPQLLHPIGRNKRSVWTIATHVYSGAHFATFPPDLIIPMIKAGCPEGGIVLDPFSGAGTTCMVAKKLNRRYIGIELNPQYIELAKNRIEKECGSLL